MSYPVRIIPQAIAHPTARKHHARRMTPREMELNEKCGEAPEHAVIYADMTEDTLEFVAITISERSE